MLVGMSAIAYTVSATLPDDDTAARYIAWLEDGHIDAVIKGGAHSAMIVRMERESPTDPPRVETRYIFATRAAFETYVQHHAPALRAEGLKLFGPASGVRFARSIGQVL